MTRSIIYLIFQGFLFDKEALLKYMIEKKQEYARKLKEYERQKDRDVKDLHQVRKKEYF